MKELIELQRALHVPKTEEGQHYNYRTVDGILSAVKKEAPDNVYIILTDDMIALGDKNYTKATATIYNGETSLFACAFAREATKLGSQSEPQISGSCSTYARKKALEGLLALDDNESDPDSPLLKADAKTGTSERSTLEEQALSAIASSQWPDAKKKAIKAGMKKHTDDFLRNVINGKV